MTPFEKFLSDAATAMSEGDHGFCEVCSGSLHFEHDHKPDGSGLDDGVPIGRTWTRRAPPKSPEELKEIRTRAWQTRREKYGKYGHR